MRRHLLSIIIIIIAALPARAQYTYDPHLWIGAHAGMTLSRMEFSPPVDQSMTPGRAFGLSIRYSEEKLFGLMAEINFTQRGWSENFKEKNDLFSYARHLTYVEIPVMTHISFGSRRVKCFVNLGPSVSYLLRETTDANFDYENPRVIPGFPLNHRIDQLTMPVSNKMDYGIQAGLGGEIIFGRHSVFIEGRYYYGLGSIYPSHKSDTFTASRGTSIILTAGYHFRIK